jgi:anti-sigma factor ChrR (cupin superfamily)
MVETNSCQLEQAASATPIVANLSDADDARWAGVVFLPPRTRLPLETGARHDIYVLKGVLAEKTRRHRIGAFLSRADDAQLTAGSDGAALFVYRGGVMPASQDLTVALDDRVWFQGGVDGMHVARLYEAPHRLTLVSWTPGTKMRSHAHPRGEEIFVLKGELRDQRGCYPAGTWQRLHPAAMHAPYAEIDTLILLRNGHLRA